MSRKIPVNNFEWIENTSQPNDDLIKSYNENSDEGYFFEIDVQYIEELKTSEKKENILKKVFLR